MFQKLRYVLSVILVSSMVLSMGAIDILPVAASDYVILSDGFDDYGLGSDPENPGIAVPTTQWSMNNGNGTTKGIFTAVDPADGQNIAARYWSTNTVADSLSLRKNLTQPFSALSSLVIRGRVRMTSDATQKLTLKIYDGSKYVEVMNFRENGNIRVGKDYAGLVTNYKPNEWVTFALYLKPGADLTQSTAVGYISGGTTGSNSNNNNIMLKKAITVDMSTLSTTKACTVMFDAALKASCSDEIYLDDIAIYQSDSLQISTPKTSHVAIGGEAVQVNFNHDIDMATFSQSKVHVVPMGGGSEVPLASVEFDPRKPNRFTLSFASLLSTSTTYNILLDDTVKDVFGYSVSGAAAFTTSDSEDTVYDPITALSLANTGSLTQYLDAVSEVAFSAQTTPVYNVDPYTIDWYVNDVKQSTTGPVFSYTPPNTIGTYIVSAKVNGNESVFASQTVMVSAVQDIKVRSITLDPNALTLWADFSLECIPAAVITPADATNKTLTWESDNPAVATVNAQTGNITPVSPGTANIVAKSTDGSNITSSKLVMTVTPAKNRPANQKLNLDPTTTPRIDVNEYLAMPANVGDGHVALWSGNKTGAYTMTVDDSITDDFEKWKAWTNGADPAINLDSKLTPEQEQEKFRAYGFPFTFFVPTDSSRNPSHVPKWKGLIDAGESVQSHTHTHSSTEEQATFTSAQIIDDFAYPIPVINGLGYANNPCRVLAFSYGTGDLNYSRQFYIAGRGVSGQMNTAGKVEYNRVGSISISGGLSLNRLRQSVQLLSDPTSSYYGGWTSLHSHGLDYTLQENAEMKAIYPDRDSFYPSEVLAYTFENYLEPAKDKLWIAKFVEVAMYGQERDTSQLTITSNAPNQIKYTLTDQMDDTMFDFPLTVKFKVDNSWTGITAYQNGESLPVSEINQDGNKYVMVETVPDRGEVTLAPAGSVEDADPITALQLNTPSNLNQVYGAAQSVAFNATPDPVTNIDRATVIWYVNDVQQGTTGLSFSYTPADAGDYVITAKVSDNPDAVVESRTIHVEQADATVTKWPSILKITAGQTFGEALGSDGVGDGTFTIQDADVAAVANLEGYQKTVTFTPNNSNYKAAQTTVTVIVKEVAQNLISAVTLNTPDNLNQMVGSTSKVTFIASAEPNTGIDEETIIWYINGELQSAVGTTFEFTPASSGTYVVSTGVSNNPGAVCDSKSVVVAQNETGGDEVVLFDDFSGYGAEGSKVLAGAQWSEVYNDASRGITIAQDPLNGNNLAARFWSTSTATNWPSMRKPVTLDKTVVFSGKMMIPTAQTTTFYLNYRKTTENVTTNILNFVNDAACSIKAGSGSVAIGNWKPGEWVKYSVSVIPNPTDSSKCQINVTLSGGVTDTSGVTKDLSFIGQSNLVVNLKDWMANQILLTNASIPANSSEVAYFDDAKIYHPASLVTRIIKNTDVATDEAVTVYFNHDIDVTTLTKDKVTVEDANHNAAAISSIEVDPMNPGSFVIHFEQGALVASKTYTVSLNNTVSDVAGFHPNGTVTFSTVAQSGPVAAPNVTADDLANTILSLDLGTMEYAVSTNDGATYGAYTSDEPELNAFGGSKKVKVRLKATETEPAGLDTVLTFTSNKGDVDGDGTINISDVIMTAEIAVGNTGYSDEQIARANVSDKSDSTVDISDVVMIAERVVGPMVTFPVDLP